MSNSVNVALDCKVYPEGKVDSKYRVQTGNRLLSAMTDGRNFYGEILSLRAWMSQLARRRALEQERPYLIGIQKQHYERQKRILTVTRYVAVLCGSTSCYRGSGRSVW